MKRAVLKKLKRHAWVIRAAGFALVFGVFTIVMAALYTAEIDDKSKLSQSEFEASVAGSQSIAAKKERDAAAKKAAEEAAKNQAAQQSAGTLPNRDPTKLDIVVNKKNPIIPQQYVPNVTTVDCAGNGSITVQVQVKDDLAALCQAAAQAGVPLAASSAYRSYSEQAWTYNYWVQQDGQAAADTYSARAGYSEHQTGYSIDFRVPGGPSLDNFTGTAQQQWLAANGPSYGFIQRYTQANESETGFMAESWHYRYVGRTIAQAFLASGKLSLESYWGLSGGGY